MKKDSKFQKLADRVLFGKRKKGITLQKQMSRIIVICCVIAVLVQVAVMAGMIINSYVRREAEDTEFLLQNANDSMNNTVQFLEERILDIQRNNGLLPFFAGERYDAEEMKQQLGASANLFSDRNRQGAQTPFATEVYLFNADEDCVSTLYYPKTVREQSERRAKVLEAHRRFLRSNTSFSSEGIDDDLAVSMHLYNEAMQEIGNCVVILSSAHVKEVYRTVEEQGECAWSIRMDGRELLGNNTIRSDSAGTFSNTSQTGFNMTLHAEISKWVVYRSLGITVALLLALSALIIAAVAVIGSFIARRYVRPLGTVAEKIRQVGQGDFDTKLGDYQAEELHLISTTFNDMTAHIDQLITQVYETQLLSQQAQIKYLQAQMDPHFLFNVLSMIELRAASNGDVDVQKKISMLSKLLQGKIFRKNEIEIPLSEEMEIVEFYLNLQNSRFGDKITYSVNYDACGFGLDRLLVPRLSIEPIVENAVAHGLEPKEGNGHIDVTVITDGDLRVIIRDDGVGFDTESLGNPGSDEEHTGVGLSNTDRMIKSHYGEEYGLQIESRINEGTTVTARLPLIERSLVDPEDGGDEGKSE